MENNLDKLFKSKLGSQEPEFHPSAWDRMEGLLDVVDMPPYPKKKKNRSKIIYLSLLFFGIFVSVIGYNSLEFDPTKGEGSILANDFKTNSDINKIENKAFDQSENAISITAKSKSNLSSSSNSNATVNNASDIKASHTNTSEIIKDQAGKTIQIFNESSTIVNEEVNTKLLKEVVVDASTNRNKELSNNANAKKQNLTNIIAGEALSNIKQNANTNQSTDLQELVGNESNGNIDWTKELNNESTVEYKTIVNSLESKSIIDKLDSEVLKVKTTLPALNILNTKFGILSTPDRQIVPEASFKKASLFEFGIQASARFNGGAGYSIGPYLTHNIGKGFAINLGGQFDSQNFDQGPELSVYDKIYSFGSKIKERKFTLDNQKSIRIPVSLSKSFYGIDISTGLIFNKVMATNGSIYQGPDIEIEQNVSIDNELIKPLTISLQLGASMNITRYFDVKVGLEYRPKAFTADPSTSTDFNTYYPTLGLRYKLFKF